MYNEIMKIIKKNLIYFFLFLFFFLKKFVHKNAMFAYKNFIQNFFPNKEC